MAKFKLSIVSLFLFMIIFPFVCANAQVPLNITWVNTFSTYYNVTVCIDNVVAFGNFSEIIIEYSKEEHNGVPPSPLQDTFTSAGTNKYCADLNQVSIWDSTAPSDTLAYSKITVKNPLCPGGICLQDNIWERNASSNWYDSRHLFIGNVVCVDNDGDGYNSSGGSCGPVDCNDSAPLIFRISSIFLDSDKDGYTFGTSVPLCIGNSLPDGYLNVSNGNDCNDSDSTKWRLLPGFADFDNDTYTVGARLDICSGNFLPSGYIVTQRPEDCNDNDNTFYPSASNFSKNCVNDAPVLSPIGDKTVSLGVTLTIILSATDPENDFLTYTKNTSIGSLSGSTFTFTPSISDNISDNQTITFTVSDGVLNDSETIKITKTDCIDSDSDGICDYMDSCVGESQSNLPSNTQCTTYSFNTSNGCHAASYRANGYVVSTSDCSYLDTTCKIYDDANNVCDGNGNLVNGTCGTWQNNNAYSLAVDCPADSCSGENWLNYVDDGFTTCVGGDINTYQCTYTSVYDATCDTDDDNDGDLDTTDCAPNDATVYHGNTNLAKNCVNDAPQLNIWLPIISDITINESESQVFVVQVLDPENDTLTYAWKINGAVQSSVSNTLTFNTDYTSNGTYKVNVTASDAEYTVSKEWTLTVRNINRAPVLAPIGNQYIALYETLSFNLSATDADNDTLIYQSDNGVGELIGKTFTFTPNTKTFYITTFTVFDPYTYDSEEIEVHVTNCIDTDNDTVCDKWYDKCIGQSQSNLPSNTSCTVYSFNTTNGCHITTQRPNGYVASVKDCSYLDTTCKLYDDVNNICNGAGTLVDGTCSTWQNNNAYSVAVDCPADSCSGENWLNYVDDGFTVCTSGAIESYQCTHTTTYDETCDPDDDNDGDLDTTDCAPKDATIYHGNTNLAKNCVNDAPTLFVPLNIEVFAEDTVTISPTVSDPDTGDTVSVSYSGWMTSNSKTTSASDVGEHKVTVTASDQSLSTQKEITVTVKENVDLEITAVKYRVLSGNVYFKITVLNSKTEKTDISYQISGIGTARNYYMDSLPSGETVIWTNMPVSSGNYNVEVFIDSNDEVEEVDETNNKMSLRVDVQ